MDPSEKDKLIIKTPAGVHFSYQLAGPISRFMSWIIDMASIAAIASIINGVLGALGVISPDFAAAASILAYFLVSIGYGIATEWYWRGQTIGKRLLRLRVMDVNGLRLQFNQVVIRNLLRFVDMQPAFYLVGGLACLINRRAQRLGDLAANTTVVWNPRISEPDLDQLMEGKYNSFDRYPHLVARMRQRVSPPEAGIALRALLRRDELEPQARVALFQMVATHFANVVRFPTEATEGLSDEQYVRNIVDILFRTRAA
jgi:uncharacterized RDD family membrane protein YckC